MHLNVIRYSFRILIFTLIKDDHIIMLSIPFKIMAGWMYYKEIVPSSIL